MDYLRVVNLEKYQHYTKRNPPWIKLHAEVFTSYSFGSLPDKAKWHALAITLLASKHDNQIPNDPAWIQRVTQSMEKPNIKQLLDIGFLEHIASDSLADCKQNGGTETEESRDRDRDREEGEAEASLKEVSKGRNGNGEVPEAWKEVDTYLSASQVLNSKQLRDWAWWETVDRVHQQDNIDLLREFAKMEEYFARKPVRARQIRDWKRFVKNWLTTASEGGYA